MRIATWNVNSVKQRIDNLTAWLSERQPDIVCLQETKCVDDAFPREPLEALGYNVAVHGQKTFNGVALLSKHRFDKVTPRLPGDMDDDHARFMEAVVTARPRNAHRVGLSAQWQPARYRKIYIQNQMDGPAHQYVGERLEHEEPLILAGDFNVIPGEADARNPEVWRGDALFLPKTRAKFNALCNLGLSDALRTSTDAGGLFTFWDYQAGAWQKNNGIRIDHLLMSPQAADRFVAVGIDKHVRAWEKPSDHVPVWADFDL